MGVVPSLTHHVNAIIKQLFIILFSLYLSQNNALAISNLHPDLRASFNGRTYPIGAQIVGSLGVAYPLWGDTQTWKYGYVRAGLNLMTSAVVNRAGIEFQLFPISILGITAGYDTGVRNFIPRWLQCDLYECTGRVDHKYLRLSFVAAAAGFSFMFITRYDEMRGFAQSSKPVFDEITLLLGKRNGENVITFNPALLYKVGDKTSVGLASLYSRALDTGGYSHLYGPVVNLNPNPKFNALIGVGLNSSPVVHSALSGFFLLQYNVVTSLSVMDLAQRTTPDVSESPKQ